MKQPIPTLSAFLVFATILSYVGNRHEVVDLLQQLSKRTRNYYLSPHRKLLHTFFVDTKLPKVPRIELRDYESPCEECFSPEWFIRRKLMKNKVTGWFGGAAFGVCEGLTST